MQSGAKLPIEKRAMLPFQETMTKSMYVHCWAILKKGQNVI